ncbi:hypothetical protein O185_12335 [Photorhabdus temperata J3]|uniref:Uncharacterized protein n=1 Tax=Photorhabdus temperata J3 TaxID=1389415 RepID=U7QXV7_PHOTE|nr:hypothetical protein O185_12335 [Photorhabdus temperata J3]
MVQIKGDLQSDKAINFYIRADRDRANKEIAPRIAHIDV